MWDALDFILTIEYVKENPTEVQLFCMLAIFVVLIACGYMAFRQGQYAWLAGGAVVILFLIGLIMVCRRLEP